MSVPAGHSGGSSSPVALVVIGIAFLVLGLLQVAKPDISYRMSRWQFKNKEAFEPSQAGLVVARVVGAVAAVVGVVLIVVAVNK